MEYFLIQDRGERPLEALKIMQQLGIGFMLDNGMEEILSEKGVII